MTDRRPSPVAGRHHVAGTWIESGSGRTFESRNPADRDDLVARFPAGTAADAAMAIRAADTALPAWRATPAPRRGEILLHFASLLRRDKERLARALTREMGKVLPEARGDVQEAIDIAELMAGEGRRMFGDTVPSELPDKWAMSIRQPIGVAGIITPWNFPIAIPAWKTMAALIAGNTVVFKPASDTPHCAALLVELLAEAGLPPGVVNLVTGAGSEVGDAIVDSPGRTGLCVHRLVGGRQADRRTGRPPAEARLARARRQERDRRSRRRGPRPGGGRDHLVRVRDDGPALHCLQPGDRGTIRASRLVEKLEARTRALRLGDGADPATDVGPLINEAARTKVEGYVEVGRREGQLVCGGRAATGPGLEVGAFFEPTIFTDVPPMARIAQEEIFGPVVSVIPVDDYAAAITAANQTRYGLSSAIYSTNVNTAFRAMRDLETGLVYVNAGTIGAETHLPFGGWKETGNGHREAGHAALDLFTEWKSIYVDFSGRLQRAQIDNQPA